MYTYPLFLVVYLCPHANSPCTHSALTCLPMSSHLPFLDHLISLLCIPNFTFIFRWQHTSSPPFDSVPLLVSLCMRGSMLRPSLPISTPSLSLCATEILGQLETHTHTHTCGITVIQSFNSQGHPEHRWEFAWPWRGWGGQGCGSPGECYLWDQL